MFTPMCMNITPLTHLLSTALCPCIGEDKTRKMKCNSRAVSLPPQGNGSWRPDWLWVSLYLCKALILLPLLLWGDKAKLFLFGEAPQGHENDCSLSVQNPFCNSCQGLLYREHSMPSQPVVWCFPALTDELWLKSHCWGLLLSNGLWQLCAPGCWIVFFQYICLLINLLMTDPSAGSFCTCLWMLWVTCDGCTTF